MSQSPEVSALAGEQLLSLNDTTLDRLSTVGQMAAQLAQAEGVVAVLTPVLQQAQMKRHHINDAPEDHRFLVLPHEDSGRLAVGRYHAAPDRFEGSGWVDEPFVADRLYALGSGLVGVSFVNAAVYSAPPQRVSIAEACLVPTAYADHIRLISATN